MAFRIVVQKREGGGGGGYGFKLYEKYIMQHTYIVEVITYLVHVCMYTLYT